MFYVTEIYGIWFWGSFSFLFFLKFGVRIKGRRRKKGTLTLLFAEKKIINTDNQKKILKCKHTVKYYQRKTTRTKKIKLCTENARYTYLTEICTGFTQSKTGLLHVYMPAQTPTNPQQSLPDKNPSQNWLSEKYLIT